ncbi:MAG: lipoyl(octanoyl) transferase LipB [Holophagales bacterium]|nr:lipoyl(octanoyl) transferase LipB [Holophagales bacterium]MYF95667.1 lipoyl(octanoyl) transferase LipB [Holophagales bacterium]
MELGNGATIRSLYLGRVSYEAGVELQHRLRRQLLDGEPDASDTLLLLEHPPTYTVGRNCDRSDVLADPDWLRQRRIAVAECDRGGRATYHGPGQLVGYPVLDLRADRRNVRGYVRDLQEVLVRTLATFGVAAVGGEERERIGVWVGRRKIASIGIHLRRWVTTHGFALNVCTDLDDFAGILSCGFDAGVMTSIEELTGRRPGLQDVAGCCAENFARVFERRLTPVEPAGIGFEPALRAARIRDDTRPLESRSPEL